MLSRTQPRFFIAEANCGSCRSSQRPFVKPPREDKAIGIAEGVGVGTSVGARVGDGTTEGETRSYTSAGDISAIGAGVGVFVGTGVGVGVAVAVGVGVGVFVGTGVGVGVAVAVGVGVGVFVGTGVGVSVAADRDVLSEGSDGVSDGLGWLQAARATTASEQTTNSPKREVGPTSLSLITFVTTILPYSHSIDSNRYQLR